MSLNPRRYRAATDDPAAPPLACERLGDPAGARTHLTAALALFTDVDEPNAREVRAALPNLGPDSTVDDPA